MKKKSYAENWDGLLPILVLGHDTMFCIVTGKAWEAAQHATDMGSGSRYNFCIVIGGRPLGRDTTRNSAAIRQRARATQPVGAATRRAV